MRKLSRRNFLGGSLAGTAALALPLAWVRGARALSRAAGGSYLEARAGMAMNTVIEVVAIGKNKAALGPACEAALDACRRIGRQMNFYDPASELSRVNRASQEEKWTEFSPELAFVLSQARRVWEESRGAFDPAVGRSVLLYRKARREGRWPSREETEAAAAASGFAFVDFDETGRRLRLARRGILLDLGGIAKGYAVDEAVRAMRGAGASAGVANAGGDLFVFGNKAGRAAGLLPVTAIEDPYAPGRIREKLEILEEGLATSGDSEQGVTMEGRPCSHLIDPATGRALSATLGSASVRAESATRADAWASALFVRPSLLETAPVGGLLLTSPQGKKAGAGFFSKPAREG